MSDMIELHHWSCYKFGTFEFRLVGYVYEGTKVKCIVTEPIITINPETALAESADGKTYKPLDVLKPIQKMDMMYVLDRWCNINCKPPPSEVTTMIQEELTRGKNEQV
jgi:hypothetical protein